MRNNMKKSKEFILEKLQSTKLITLGTISENIPWSSPMYFTFDKNLVIYVLLDTITQHMKNLIFFPKASVTLTSKNDKQSIQFAGDVQIFSKQTVHAVKKQYDELSLLHSGDIDSLNNGKDLDWRIIKFIPKRIFLISAENSSDRQEIFLNETYKKSLLN